MSAEELSQFMHLLRRELTLRPLLHCPQRTPEAEMQICAVHVHMYTFGIITRVLLHTHMY